MEMTNNAVEQQESFVQMDPPSEYYIDEDAEKEYPIRTIFQLFGPFVLADKNIVLSSEQRKAISCISNCRTGSFGYNSERCPNCNKLIIHPRSCNNRFCPNCQYLEELQWVQLRKAEVIEGIPYYHVVVTIPSELYPIASANRFLFYNLLMKSAPGTLVELCRSEKYGSFTPSVVSVFHSWSSKMQFHPHVHMILSGGGLTSDNNFKEAPYKEGNKFFIPESVVAALFRGKMMAALKEAYENPKISLNLPSSSEFNLEDPRQWMNFCDKPKMVENSDLQRKSVHTLAKNSAIRRYFLLHYPLHCAIICSVDYFYILRGILWHQLGPKTWFLRIVETDSISPVVLPLYRMCIQPTGARKGTPFTK